MTPSLNLHGAKILVTGATGFIGGRLVEYLVLHHHARVKALIRSYGRAIHLARLPVELVPGDLMDPESLKKASADCDVIIHCAYGNAGEDEERRSVTFEGTRNILDAALEGKVKRFIHVSTIAVHGPDPGLIVDEQTPLVYTNEIYGDAKIDAEKLVFQYGKEKGLPIVVLRPTIVYGPRAGGWTLDPLNKMKQGTFTLIEGGSGIANHVYVDDVVQAMILAAQKPEAVGESFIVSYGGGVTWKEFYGYYARMLGVELPDLPVQKMTQLQNQMKQLRNPFYWGLSFAASPHARSVVNQLPGVGGISNLIVKMIPDSSKQALLNQAYEMRELKLNPPNFPRQWIIDLFCAKGICKIDKAQRLLGYQPQFSLEEGMRLTEAWLRFIKMI